MFIYLLMCGFMAKLDADERKVNEYTFTLSDALYYLFIRGTPPRFGRNI